MVLLFDKVMCGSDSLIINLFYFFNLISKLDERALTSARIRELKLVLTMRSSQRELLNHIFLTKIWYYKFSHIYLQKYFKNEGINMKCNFD